MRRDGGTYCISYCHTHASTNARAHYCTYSCAVDDTVPLTSQF